MKTSKLIIALILPLALLAVSAHVGSASAGAATRTDAPAAANSSSAPVLTTQAAPTAATKATSTSPATATSPSLAVQTVPSKAGESAKAAVLQSPAVSNDKLSPALVKKKGKYSSSGTGVEMHGIR